MNTNATCFFKPLLMLMPLAVGLVWVQGCTPSATVSKIKADSHYGEAQPFFDNGTMNAQALPANVVSDHPGLNHRGHNSMHGDAYNSDTHPYAGPMGTHLVVDSADMATFVGGQCGNNLMTNDGIVISYCAELGRTALYAMRHEAGGFRRLAEGFKLVNRESNATGDIATIMNDTSGGAYFHMDSQNRVVLADARNVLRLIQLVPGGTTPYTHHFEEVANYDLDVGLPALTLEDGSHVQPDITQIIPDWNVSGLYWFVTRQGHIGTVDTRSGSVTAAEIHLLTLPGEEIQNSLAMDANGVYIVSDFAMYRYRLGSNQEPVQVWRQTYDRGTGSKVGQINQGSGTTPTLLGVHDDLVAITDNADAAVQIVVYKRNATAGDGSNPPVCAVPVFNDPEQANGDGTFRSASDNSLIAHHDALVVENNYGYTLPTANNWTTPGIWRVDVDRNGSGEAVGCHVQWKNNTEASQTVVPKLSLGNGLIYIYTREPIAEGAPTETTQAYYLGAVNFSDGNMAFKVLTGTGRDYNNNYSPIMIGADGAVYVGVFAGLVTVRHP